MSFVGSIVGTQGEQVEVAFDIDKTAAAGTVMDLPGDGNKPDVLYAAEGNKNIIIYRKWR